MDHSDSDCVAVFIMSHDYGNGSKIFSRDTYYDNGEWPSYFTSEECPSLAGKPKLFFFQVSFSDLYHYRNLSFKKMFIIMIYHSKFIRLTVEILTLLVLLLMTITSFKFASAGGYLQIIYNMVLGFPNLI